MIDIAYLCQSLCDDRFDTLGYDNRSGDIFFLIVKTDIQARQSTDLSAWIENGGTQSVLESTAI